MGNPVAEDLADLFVVLLGQLAGASALVNYVFVRVLHEVKELLFELGDLGGQHSVQVFSDSSVDHADHVL